jgi:large-conductance mechanosensitive channel
MLEKGGAGMWQEFKAFAMRGNVLALAIGIIRGRTAPAYGWKAE